MVYIKPKTVSEALKQGRDKSNMVFISGGTDLMVLMSEGIIAPEIMIDLSGLEELRTVMKDEKGLFLGAGLTMSELASGVIDGEKVPAAISMGAGRLGSPQIRNLATLGGNICNASPCGDTLPGLSVLEALFLIKGPDGDRWVKTGDFFLAPKKTVLKNGEILAGVLIPAGSLNGASGFFKTGKRKGQTISQVNAAVFLEKDRDKLKTLRIAAGSVAPVPVRLIKTEELILNNQGNSFTAAFWQEAEEIIDREISPITDVRASEEYRRLAAAKSICWMVQSLIAEGAEG